MREVGPRTWTRRTLLYSVAGLAAAAERGRLYPPERISFADPATEFTVVRLTDPSHSSWLTAPCCRAVSRRGDFLVCGSDRAGSPQAFRINEKTGELRQLTEARELDGASLTLMPDDRSLLYFDGPSLRQVAIGNLRERELYRVPDGWRRGQGFGAPNDGSHASFIEVRDGIFRLRLLRLPRRDARTVLESSGPISQPLPRPRRDELLYRDEAGSLWVIGCDGRNPRRLPVGGRAGPAFWSPDGRSVLYLSFPEGPGRLNEIRECDPDAGADGLIAATSQFVQFAANADGSVFAGASGSVASPYILLLVRATRRELAICEHRASDPTRVAPRFSHDSQRVYFNSDRDGRPAIYCTELDRLIEPTR